MTRGAIVCHNKFYRLAVRAICSTVTGISVSIKWMYGIKFIIVARVKY
jgi:hypothetical protein